eukprot:Skav228284  [mRNA]  locus=scaffold1313:103528:126255:- [translate_table: standard]
MTPFGWWKLPRFWGKDKSCALKEPSGACPEGAGAALVGSRISSFDDLMKKGGYEYSRSLDKVKAAQKAWADAIKKISKTYLDGGDYVAAAAKAAGELYGYGHGKVLFKPTKAKDVQFRPEASQAMSYFVGAKAVKEADGIAEDGGFAINGGKGWSDVESSLALGAQLADVASQQVAIRSWPGKSILMYSSVPQSFHEALLVILGFEAVPEQQIQLPQPAATTDAEVKGPGSDYDKCLVCLERFEQVVFTGDKPDLGT